jgi:8-oxo-dGTP pyrophosphatase MutT (NUDIX family)
MSRPLMPNSKPKRLPMLTTIPQFDPKTAPLLPRDERFKALPQSVINETFLTEQFKRSLKSLQTHNAHIPQNPLLKPSAVLIPVMQREDGLTILLTVRSAQLRKHSGQIALPGGKIDLDDENAIATALREAEEEIGLPSANCQVIGALSQHETGTGFEITPILALVNPNFTPRLSEVEVSEIFEVPLAHLLDPNNHFHHQLTWSTDEGTHTRDWYAMPSTDTDGVERHIWGVTARVLRNFYEHLHGTPHLESTS